MVTDLRLQLLAMAVPYVGLGCLVLSRLWWDDCCNVYLCISYMRDIV